MTNTQTENQTMTFQEYEKKATPLIKKVLRQLKLEFDEMEYEQLVKEAYDMSLVGQKLTQGKIFENHMMHKEFIRSAAIAAYKRTHWVPTVAATLNILTGALMLGGFVYFTTPICPVLSVNFIMQIISCWMIMLSTWKKHVPMADKIRERRAQVRMLECVLL